MKTSFYAVAILISGYCNAQTKFHNISFPNFDRTKMVKPAKVQTITNRFTKQKQGIIEYNQNGVKHGATIEFRNGAPFLEYYHNGHIVYKAVPFSNSNKYQTIQNFDDYGNFDGEQINNKSKEEFSAKFKNGRLTHFNDTGFPDNYKISFKEGKLDGDFFFYDSLSCDCFYFGKSEKGKIIKINQIQIRKDLTYIDKSYEFQSDNEYNRHHIDTRYNIAEGDYYMSITNYPIVVENRDIDTGGAYKIVFDKQLDWTRILFSDSENNQELEQIDLSDTQYGSPEPYTYPN